MKKQCSIEGCMNKHLAKGWCYLHYQRITKHGDPNYVDPRTIHSPICTVEECKSKFFAKGFCEIHYRRFLKYNDPHYILRPYRRKPGCTHLDCKEKHFSLGLCIHHYSQKRKRIVFDNYGGQCECCGESRHEFLCIDHINGDGKADRKHGRKGAPMYIWLRRNNYPKDRYRLLCFNCNQSLGAYGYCPHQRP